MVRTCVLVLALACGTAPAAALETPRASSFDERVKSVSYNPDDVVRIVAHFGFQTHVEFDETETVKYIALGDPAAWEIAPKDNLRNHLFIKPVGERATTNLTVVTVRGGRFRSYQFLLTAQWPKLANAAKTTKAPDMYFNVKFRYPDDERRAAQARDAAGDAKRALHAGEDPARPRNWNYSVCGSTEIAPDEGHDDGTFTYLRWAANREIPAVFHVNDDGSEQLVNMHVDAGDWHVIDRVSRKLVLRKGSAVACVTNEAFDPRGYRPSTRTTSPNVERVIKGGQP